jgi:nicotinamidase-related amidase
MAGKIGVPKIIGGPHTALLVIDVQRGLFNKGTPIYHAVQLLENIQLLVDEAHAAGAMVVYVQHSAERQLVKGSQDWQLHPLLQPQQIDLRLHKLQGNSFEGTLLQAELEKRGVGRVVCCGLVTHGCVKATALGALQLGYQVVVAGDTHSSYSGDAARLINQWNEKLAQAGVEVLPAKDIMFKG